jgi:MFS family permease
VKNNSAVRVAVGGLVSAFSLVIMLCTGIFPFGTYAFPLIAGVLLISIFIEFGFKWSILVYVVVSIMSLFFVSDKEAALFFTLLFGYYPIVKSYIERLSKRVIQYIIKFGIFNASAVSVYFLMLFVFNLPKDAFEVFGVNLPLVFLIVGNFAFIIYDKCINVLVAQYLSKYRKILFKR